MSAATKPLAEMRFDALKNGKVKYPLECGCSGEHYNSLCDGHQNEYLEDMRRLMGIADMRFTHRDFTDLQRLVQALHAIKLQLISNPTKSCIIKIIPETQDETDASRRD
jgi:hypothetical protein